MAKRIIECADCGTEHETRAYNTKYCPICRLFRNLVRLKDVSIDCALCEKPFAPTYRGAWVCWDCDPNVESRCDVTCGICHREAKGAYSGLSVCTMCLSSPEHRKTLLQALAHKIKVTKEDNGRS